MVHSWCHALPKYDAYNTRVPSGEKCAARIASASDAWREVNGRVIDRSIQINDLEDAIKKAIN